MQSNSSFYLSTQAESDMESLFEDTRRRLNLGSAEGMVLDISIAFRRLANADTGDGVCDCSHISPGLQARPVGPYMIYFRREDDGVNILRVLHESLHQENSLSH